MYIENLYDDPEQQRAYERGCEFGYEEGKDEAEEQYDWGYEAGYSEGSENGYEEGFEDGQNEFQSDKLADMFRPTNGSIVREYERVMKRPVTDEESEFLWRLVDAMRWNCFVVQ